MHSFSPNPGSLRHAEALCEGWREPNRKFFDRLGFENEKGVVMSMSDGKGLGCTKAQAQLDAEDGVHIAVSFLGMAKCPRCGKAASTPSCEGKCLKCGNYARSGEYCDSCMSAEIPDLEPGETLSPTYMQMPHSWW